MSYRKHWRLWVVAAVAAGVLSAGCKKQGAGGATGSDGDVADRPAQVDKNRKAASSLEAPPLFAHIPADTPYVFAAFEPFPDDYWSWMMDGVGPAFDDIFDRALSDANDVSGDPEGAIVKAIVAELRGKLNAKGFESLGFKSGTRFAIYGVGWYPVFRLELENGQALRDAVSRVETAVGAKLPRKTLDGVEYFEVGDSDVGALLAIRDKELVGAMFGQAGKDVALPYILGIRKPEKSMADGAALKKIAADYGFGPYALGYVDSVRAAQIAFHELAPGMPASCKKQLLASLARVPRVVMGYDEVTKKTMSMTMMVETAPDLAKKLKALRASVPGVSTRFPEPPLMAFGGGLDQDATFALLRDLAGEISRVGKVCDSAELIEAGAELSRDIDQPFPPAAKGINGGAIVALDASFGMSGIPSDVSGYAVVGAKNTKELLGFAKAIASSMGLKIEAGGDFKKQDFDLPFVPDLHVAAKKEVLAIAAGDKGLAAVKAALSQKGPSPLFYFAYDYGRIMSMVGDSFGAFGQNEDPAMQKVIKAQADKFGLIAMWAYASDRGLGVRVRMDMK